MKHPVRSDFDTTVTETGVRVTFKPTNSIYSFLRLADSHTIARLGPGSLGSVRHGELGGDTGDYAPDEVQDMAQHVASDVAASVWTVQDEQETEELTTVGPFPVVGDRGD